MALFRNAHSQGLSTDCNWHNISHLICFCLEWEGRGSRRDLFLLRSWRRRGHQYVETYLKHLNASQAAIVKLPPPPVLCHISARTDNAGASHKKGSIFFLSSRAIVECSISYLCDTHFRVPRSNTLFIVAGLRDINEYDCSILHLCLDSMHLYLTWAGSFSVLLFPVCHTLFLAHL